ncbi:MAG: glycosyltransferase family 39 protein [Aggregatilineales bacterium]
MKQSIILFIVLVLLLGSASLIHNLDTYEDLWVDEGWSVEVTQFSNLADATDFIASDVHPPFYFYILYIWEQFVGQSVFALRYLSLLIVLITTCIVYLLGRTCVNRTVGLFGASLYLSHDLVHVLGREIRQYPLLQLFTVLTIYAYWQFWKTPTRRAGIFFVMSGAALLWTHYWGGFVLLALFIHMLITRRQYIIRMFMAFGAIGVAFMPWLPLLYTQITDNVSEGIGHALPASRTGYEVLAFQIVGRPEIFWILLIGAGIFAIYTKFGKSSAKTLLFVLVIFLPLVLSIVLNTVYASLSFRVLSLIIPVAMIVIASSVMLAPKIPRLILGMLILVISLSLTSAQPPVRLPWQSVAQYVTLRSDANDAVLIETWFDSYAYMYYLREGGRVSFLSTELMARDADSDDLFSERLQESLVEFDGLWVTRFSPQADISPLLNDLGYTRTGTVIQETRLVPIELWRFDRVNRFLDASGEPSEEDGSSVASFENQMQIVDYSTVDRPQTLTVQFLWSALESLAQNYTVSVFLLDENGVLVTQDDSPPLEGNQPTSTWQVGTLYYDAHVLDTSTLPAGSYQLAVKLYWFTDEDFEELRIVKPGECDDPCEFIVLSSVQVGG